MVPEQTLVLIDIAYSNDVDVLAVVPTWHTKNISDQEILPVGYKIIRRDRQEDRRVGGVLLAVKDTFETGRFSFSSKTVELVSTAILSRNSKILLEICYRAPDFFKEFVSELHRFLKLATDSFFEDIILIGDFNFPKIVWNNGSGFSNLNMEHCFCDIMTEYNFL